MNTTFSYNKFYSEMEFSLPGSTAEKRKMWAIIIIEENIEIKDISRLLKCERKVASRFLWLLSEVGVLNPNKLFLELPFLLDLSDHLNHGYQTSFATFWLIAGVPLENEARAIHLLFQWLLSAKTNVTTKSRSLLVLLKLTKKYPELKHELKLCIEDQMDKYTNDFKKRATKILSKLEQ
ncbi:MAG: hypothetical protein ABI723_18795 [Bacteroidia bacterium]